MSVNPVTVQNTELEAKVLHCLRRITGSADGSDVVTARQVFTVVAISGVVRVFLDPQQVPESQMEDLAMILTPLVKAVSGVERVIVKPRPQSVYLHDKLPGIGHVIAIHSGKGGVGKSTVAVNLAVALAQSGLRIGLLDADIYGPSCPTLLGIQGRAESTTDGRQICPPQKHGVKVMSLGLLLPPGEALVWRGSLVETGMSQLFSDVAWGELDMLLVDLPPGTSDVHLAVARHAPLDGVLAVTAPGQVAVDDVRRGLEMYADIKVPCLGLIENMAGFTCGHCGATGPLFGNDGGKDLALETGITLLASLPFEPAITLQGDAGVPIVIANPGSSSATTFTQLALCLKTHYPAIECPVKAQ